MQVEAKEVWVDEVECASNFKDSVSISFKRFDTPYRNGSAPMNPIFGLFSALLIRCSPLPKPISNQIVSNLSLKYFLGSIEERFT